mmetsp:Transcript_113464/g.315980  ORF Transcript_113464/g.315980 Transcript_113464/m.315980 type:complete len:305 (-) Transcript_113464:1-915(-)
MGAVVARAPPDPPQRHGVDRRGALGRNLLRHLLLRVMRGQLRSAGVCRWRVCMCFPGLVCRLVHLLAAAHAGRVVRGDCVLGARGRRGPAGGEGVRGACCRQSHLWGSCGCLALLRREPVCLPQGLLRERPARRPIRHPLPPLLLGHYCHRGGWAVARGSFPRTAGRHCEAPLCRCSGLLLVGLACGRSHCDAWPGARQLLRRSIRDQVPRVWFQRRLPPRPAALQPGAVCDLLASHAVGTLHAGAWRGLHKGRRGQLSQRGGWLLKGPGGETCSSGLQRLAGEPRGNPASWSSGGRRNTCQLG